MPNAVQADLYMNMRYDTAFGIYDHDLPDPTDAEGKLINPWPLMIVSPKEDLSKVDPLDFRLDQFIENRVFDLTGISFDVAMSYSRADYLKLIAKSKKHAALVNGLGADLKKLEDQLRKAGATPPKP